MTDAEVIGDPTELGVVEAVWLCGHHGIPATAENLEWYVCRFWDEGVHTSVTPEDARRYIAAALDAGELMVQVSPELETVFHLSADTATKVALRYEYWNDQRQHDEACAAVVYACEQFHAATEGEWPFRDALVSAVIRHVPACEHMAEAMVDLAAASGALTHFLFPCDRTDYPEVGRAMEVLRPYWRLRPKEA